MWINVDDVPFVFDNIIEKLKGSESIEADAIVNPNGSLSMEIIVFNKMCDIARERIQGFDGIGNSEPHEEVEERLYKLRPIVNDLHCCLVKLGIKEKVDYGFEQFLETWEYREKSRAFSDVKEYLFGKKQENDHSAYILPC